jgi:CSLREA domain-containing protein
MHALKIRFALVAAVALILACAEHATAALINVTIKTDVVADDGKCSLREAVTAANRNLRSGRSLGECPAGEPQPVVDVIQLRRGKYKLALEPAGEDGNLGGDLDVTESLLVQGKNGRATVIVNKLGDPLVVGDGDRLFHVDPSAKGGVDVTFANLALSRGDVGCSGAQCDPGASAVDARGSGALAFDRCTIMRGTATCDGDGCGTSFGGAAIATLGGGALTIRNSTIKKNDASCATEGCAVSGAGIAVSNAGIKLAPDVAATPREFLFDDSTLTESTGSCDASFCFVGATVIAGAQKVVVSGSTITSSRVACNGAECATQGLLVLEAAGGGGTLDDVELRDNAGECRGNTCALGNVLGVGSTGSTTLRDLSFDANSFTCTGARCFVASHAAFAASTNVGADGLVLTSETASCAGVGCQVSTLLRVESAGVVDVAGGRIEGNQLGCSEDQCVVESLVDLVGVPLQGQSSRLADNVVGCDGEGCKTGSWLTMTTLGNVELASTTLVNNRLQCAGESCATGPGAVALVDQGDLRLPTLTLEDNDLICTGPACSVSDMLAFSATGGIAIAPSRAASNELTCVGVLCKVGRLGNLDAARIGVDSAVVTANTARCDGISCRAAGTLQIAASEARLSRSSITGNTTRCDDDDCQAGPGGALRNSSGRLEIIETSLTGNKTDGFGAAIFNDAGAKLELDLVSLTGNEAGLRGTMALGGFGGGIYNDAGNGQRGVVSMENTEIRQNRASRTGGGILNVGIVGRVERSVIALNSTGDCVDRGGSGCP